MVSHTVAPMIKQVKVKCLCCSRSQAKTLPFAHWPTAFRIWNTWFIFILTYPRIRLSANITLLSPRTKHRRMAMSNRFSSHMFLGRLILQLSALVLLCCVKPNNLDRCLKPLICFHMNRWSSGGGTNLETGSYPPTPQAFYNPQSPDPSSMGRDTPSVHSATSETPNSRQVDGRTTYIIL